MRAVYPSDITREQFSMIEYDLKSARKATRPRTYDLYDIFCAILYVLKEGCTWRGLPHVFQNGTSFTTIQEGGAVSPHHRQTCKQVCNCLIVAPP
jgi:transposase